MTAGQDPLSRILKPIEGARIDGGCDRCDAYQIVRPLSNPGVWGLTVFHEDWCPVLHVKRDGAA